MDLSRNSSAKEALAIRQFEYADKNQDAKLSFEESRKAVNGISQGQFIALDEDGDGLHSFEEIDKILLIWITNNLINLI